MAAAALGDLELLRAMGFSELGSQKQTALHGHTDNVSWLSASRDGLYVAPGQVTSMDFKANIILWDFQQESLARLSLRNGRIEGLVFSPSSLYLMSLGGQDDSSGTVQVWELDPVNRKIHPTECQTGHLRRLFTCVQMTKDNSYFYVGTSGDILKVNTKQEDDG